MKTNPSIRGIGVVILLTLLFSCTGGRGPSVQEAGDTVSLKYATQLSIVRHKDYTEVVVKNPWKEGKILHSYLLVPDSIDPQDISHSSLSTVVRTPLRRSVMFTTVHCAMLMSFGCEQSIAGVADLKYIKIPWIHEQVKAGRITDVGEGMSPVVEKIIDQRPDALFLSPFENSGGYGRLEEIGIPIIECAEYMEPSPLARAEWLRFYGMLFGCEARADSLFAVVDSSYNALKKLFTVDSLSSCVPTVASGKAERTDDYSAASSADPEGLASKSTVNCKPSTVNNNTTLFLKVDGEYRQIAISQIIYVSGMKDYVMFYLEGERRPLVTYLRMKAVEEMLPPQQFMRVHRSFIVALDKIRKVDRNDCIYIGDEIIHVTEAYLEKFQNYLKRMII